MIVLDIMLPGLDGFTITRSLRDPAGRARAAPRHAAATSRSSCSPHAREEADRIAGFELGTDDYVTKPFSPRELVMRIKAVLRRSAAEVSDQEKPLICGDLAPGSRHAQCYTRRAWISVDRQRIRSVVVSGAPSPPGVQPHAVAGSCVGLRVLWRRQHRHGAYSPPARKNRRRPRPTRCTFTRCGASGISSKHHHETVSPA